MSINHFTANLLEIKDPNVIFTDEISHMVKNKVQYKVIHAKLTYQPTCCLHCGTINDNHSIIKHGTKYSNILLLSCNGEPMILRLQKQRFLCKSCNSTFTAKTSLVEKDCFISKRVKLKILDALTTKVSEKDIAANYGVSHATVSRLIDSSYTTLRVSKEFLPKHLMFDEFKSTKDAVGAMSFIFADAKTHTISDIVENRQLPYLRRYFSQYTKEARNSVETICIDMYEPYMTLIKETFPKAKILVDKFHLVQLLNRAFQKTRIEVLNTLSTKSLEYKRLKRYWKLLSKDQKELNGIHFYKQTYFNFRVSEQTLVRESLMFHPQLQRTYQVYQDLLTAIQDQDHSLFQRLLQKAAHSDISSYMKTALTTLQKYSGYIANTFTYSFTNGPLEGLNNFIKVMKRIAFGYKSFYHFRNRILITKNLIQPIKKYQTT